MWRVYFLLLAGFVPGACATQHQVATFESLWPVDKARGIVVFDLQTAEACGEDAMAGAIQDLTRRTRVHGYVGVTIDAFGRGDDRCVRASGFPFRYGDDTSVPGVVGDRASPHPIVIPARSGQPAGRSIESECQRVAALVESVSIKITAEREACVRRAKAEPTFFTCVIAARDSPSYLTCRNGDTR